jgi:hypothetical protein
MTTKTETKTSQPPKPRPEPNPRPRPAQGEPPAASWPAWTDRVRYTVTR